VATGIARRNESSRSIRRCPRAAAGANSSQVSWQLVAGDMGVSAIACRAGSWASLCGRLAGRSDRRCFSSRIACGVPPSDEYHATSTGNGRYRAVCADGLDSISSRRGWRSIISNSVEYPGQYAALVPIALAGPFKWEPFQIIRITAFPTIRDGTVVVVDRRGFPRLPERGSLILFNAPDDARIPNISRAIGLPGDTIQNRSGTLLLNGTAVPRQLYGSAEMAMDDQTVAVRLFTETLPGRRPYNIARANSSSSVNDTPPMTIPPGHIYVLGDNRDFSFDSRYPKRGLIPVTNLLGTTAVITRSPDWADFLSVPN